LTLKRRAVVLVFVLSAAVSLPAQVLLSPAGGAPEIVSQAAVVIDAATGTPVYYKNPDEEIPPASLTKLMTMHLVLKEAAMGRLSLDELVRPPRESWSRNQPYRSSLMFLADGQEVSVRELLLGLAVPSGNDAAVALALRLASSVEDFAAMMNREAESLGLVKTRFVEPSGISEYNFTTAREFASFCKTYIDEHPETLREFHSIGEFAYPKAENVAAVFRANPGTVVQYNHNNLLGKVEGVDGLKTGYIDEAGYNIALTAERGGTRFIAVILGAPAQWGGDRLRDEDGRKLLEWAFARYKTVRPLNPELDPVRVWKGTADFAGLAAAEPLEFTAPVERAEKLYFRTELTGTLIAPLPAGSAAGDLVLYDDLGELRRIPLVTAVETEQGGFFKRVWDSIRLFFHRPSG
jgi:D-alanyl-D-alanine carboxypeptidase (penicillin-binding protein 5/6)